MSLIETFDSLKSSSPSSLAILRWIFLRRLFLSPLDCYLVEGTVEALLLVTRFFMYSVKFSFHCIWSYSGFKSFLDWMRAVGIGKGWAPFTGSCGLPVNLRLIWLLLVRLIISFLTSFSSSFIIMDQFLFESKTLFTFSSNFYYKLCIFYLGSTSDWSLVESVNDVEYAFLLKANVHFVYAGFFMLQWACAVYGFPFFSFINFHS